LRGENRGLGGEIRRFFIEIYSFMTKGISVIYGERRCQRHLDPWVQGLNIKAIMGGNIEKLRLADADKLKADFL